MAHAAGDSHPYPVYGAHFRVVFPIPGSTGNPLTGLAGVCDSEISKDQGAVVDCTNEATEIGTSGWYYLDLTGAEMTAKHVAISVKTDGTGGSKTTPLSFYPVRLSVLESGTAQNGFSSGLTLKMSSGSNAADGYYAGLYVLITDDTEVGSQYQLRKIISYAGSSKIATIDSAWGTIPGASAYSILIPDGLSVYQASGTALSSVSLAATGLAAVTSWTIAITGNITGNLSGSVGSVTGAVGSVTGDIGGNVLGTVATVNAFAANSITAAAMAADAVAEIWTTALTESYAADGATFTPAQALFEICQAMTEFVIVGTTITVKKRDGSTTALTYTLDSATSPTSRTRAT